MKRLLYATAVAVTAVISLAFWAIMISAIAWSIVFLTGALHGSGLTFVPALSFWQSAVASLAVLSLMAFLLRAARRGRRRGR